MEDSLSFMNWGFAPSKNASGWVLCETGYYWWEDMRWRDARDFEIAGRNYSINSIKKVIIKSVMQFLDKYLYDRGNVEYTVLDDGTMPFADNLFPITVLGKKITLPNMWNDYFPAEFPNCENYYIYDCVEEIPDNVQQIIRDDSIWYERVIEPFLLKELEWVEDRIIEITKTQNPKYPKLIATIGMVRDYEIETTSIWLTSIQEL
tara:strand:- start:44441 stop:45055 length:615 start_codon:yes stop_codon:yes gene_type:complete